MRKTQILMNKPVYLGVSILDLNKTVTYQFWYDYVKPKYGENAKLCYMDTDSSILHVKTDDIDTTILQKILKQDLTLYLTNYELDRPLSKGKTKKLIGLMKGELGEQIMKEFVGLRAKTYSCLKDNVDKDKRVKSTKTCIIKRKLKFQNYKNCLEVARIENKITILKTIKKNKIDVDSPEEFIKNNKLILKIKQRFKSENHNFFTEEINKTALSSNDDKKCNQLIR